MADRYWVGGSGNWDTSNTANWSAANPITISSASRAGNTLTTTGSPALAIGMTVWYSVDQYTGAFASLGTITGGSGNSWTTSGSGTISSQAMYAATTGASFPTSADNVRFGAYAGSELSTVSVSGPNSCLSFFHTGYIEFATSGGSPMIYVNGSFTMNFPPASMTFPVPLTFVGSNTGRNFYSNGVTHGDITVDASGGAITIQDNLTADDFTLANGSLTCASGIQVTVATFNSNNSNTRSITFSNSTWTLNSAFTSTVWNCTTSANLTVSYTPGGATLIFSSPNSVNFYGGGKSWPSISNALTESGTTSSNNVLTIADGSNTFYNVSVTASVGKARSIKFIPGPTTYILNDFTLTGISGALVYLASTSISAFTLSKSSGTVSASYATITSSTVTGGATWLAYTANGNVNGGSNTGWVFSQGSSNFLMFF